MHSTQHDLDHLFDVIIIGAGIAGINAAYRIQTELPSASYTILEARDGIGGTWDLFRYPGFRSDSDLYTFGLSWRPWTDRKIIADGDSIRRYIRESAALHGIDQKVRFRHRLLSANWSSDQQAWDLLVDNREGKNHVHARFLIFGTGYYDYDEALGSYIPGIENFTGTRIHPQFWPEHFDYKDKKIIVVGSGSTAVTLIPSLAETASHVTMLQRSPSYILSWPSIDSFGQWIRRILPDWLAYRINRLRFLLMTPLVIKICGAYPRAARYLIKKITQRELPENMPYDPHFSPRYNPWEQRLCLCPDGDFFKAIRAGKVSIATDTISTVTETGIRLTSGQTLDADIIVTATGLKIKIAGGASISVDRNPIAVGEKFLWKGVLLQDVPNMALMMGSMNSSWTLGADAAALLVCRLLNIMKSKGIGTAVPRLDDAKGMKSLPMMHFISTYVVKGEKELPRTGDKGPWMRRSSYFSDLWNAKFGNMTDGLHFEKLAS